MSVVRVAKLLSALILAGCVASGTIGGAYYDPAYDYSEFFAVTDGRSERPRWPGDTGSDFSGR